MGNSVSDDNNYQRAAQVDIASNTDSYSNQGTQINLIGCQDEDIDFFKHHPSFLSENSEYFSQRKNGLKFLSQRSECNAFIEEPFPFSIICNSILSNDEHLLENQCKNFDSCKKLKDKIYEFNAIWLDDHGYFNESDNTNQGFNRDIEMGQCDNEKVENCDNYDDEDEDVIDEECKNRERFNESDFNI
ncbi:hypothetical protein SteCoe_8934 [Stentor coeruleus]|uniref:Uncharacterized protein n=1 Tax=Stentor coeruleus TaxID=5963 RepID=A0A1R2CJ83_9CILI|nr:hypothetical protein SteCoe_8934 [Stentor coeruleus]